MNKLYEHSLNNYEHLLTQYKQGITFIRSDNCLDYISESFPAPIFSVLKTIAPSFIINRQKVIYKIIFSLKSDLLINNKKE